MTPEEWAEVFEAGWNAPHLVKHSPPGDAIAIALAAMSEKCREIAARRAAGEEQDR